MSSIFSYDSNLILNVKFVILTNIATKNLLVNNIDKILSSF